ncbi:MAG TPA: ChrR family anti-sigma-E factor [Polyangia bacterium]|nr:ChrR family anti-sigma-E factor [Polyangia bacterium]
MTTNPTHHVPDERLAEYAAGACGEAPALGIACHVSLCAACAARLRAFEAVGGAVLETGAPDATAPGALEAVLARLDDVPAELPAVDPAAERLLAPLGVPRVVWRYLAPGAAAAGWRRLVPGIAGLDLRVGAAGTMARLVRLRPGLEIPLHDHGGDEHTVILTGALADDEGRFARGDISIRAAGARHVQRVEHDEPCVALVVNEGALVPLTLKGKLLGLFWQG